MNADKARSTDDWRIAERLKTAKNAKGSTAKIALLIHIVKAETSLLCHSFREVVDMLEREAVNCATQVERGSRQADKRIRRSIKPFKGREAVEPSAKSEAARLPIPANAKVPVRGAGQTKDEGSHSNNC